MTYVVGQKVQFFHAVDGRVTEGEVTELPCKRTYGNGKRAYGDGLYKVVFGCECMFTSAEDLDSEAERVKELTK